MDAIEKTQEELAAALGEFDRAKASLYRPDGSAKYAPAEHDERLRALTEKLHGHAERLDAAAEAEIRQVGRLVEANGDDPSSHLTTAELQAASARQAFVKEDCESLPLAELVARVRGVAAANELQRDRPSAYLWSRYARRRIAAAAEEGGAAAYGPFRAHLEELERLAGALEQSYGASVRISELEAKRRVRRAREAQREMRERVAVADGTRERMVAEMRSRLSVF